MNYPFVYTAGLISGMETSEIVELISKAKMENAPKDAWCFKDGKWHTVSQLNDLAKSGDTVAENTAYILTNAIESIKLAG